MLNRNPPRSGWLLPVQMLQAPEEKHEQQKPTAPVTPGRADLVLQLASPSCPLHWAATPNRDIRGTRSSLLNSLQPAQLLFLLLTCSYFILCFTSSNPEKRAGGRNIPIFQNTEAQSTLAEVESSSYLLHLFFES